VESYTSDAEQAAVDYRQRGWSPLPLKMRLKVPKLPKGHPFLGRKATDEEHARFDFRHNVGIVAGKVSGIIVLDDDDDGETMRKNDWRVPPTPTVRTKRGHQYYFRCPEEGLPTFDVAGKLEVRGDGSYVVAPPSVHPSGAVYEWVISPDEAELAEPPAWLIKQAAMRGRRMTAEDVGETIANGSRNKTLFSVACTLRRRGLDEETIYLALLGINGAKCETPLDEDEVRKIAGSSARYEAAETQSDPPPIDSDHIHGGFDRNKSTLPLRTVEEIIEEAGDGPSWVVENILARGALTDFSGLAKKGGKTTFWLHGIAAGARGEDHGGFATEPAKYLYLTEQGNNFAEALQDAGLSDHPDYVRIVQFKDVSTVEWERLIREAGAETKRLGFDVLVVDTFAVFARLKGSEENDSGAVGDRMRVLRLVAQRYGIAVVLIRHAGKDGTPRGSSAFEAEADICVSISRPEGRHDPSVRKLSGVGRYGEWERNVQLHEGRYISLGTDDRIEFTKAVRFVKSVLPESPEAGMKKPELLDRRGEADNISSATLARALQWLVKQGDVGEKQIMDRRGKPKVYWLAYKPPGGDGGIYFNQTPTHNHDNDRNKPEGVETPLLTPREEAVDDPTDGRVREAF
jgi:hypothetical protein